MRDHGVFEPGDLSGLDFQTWLAQIDDVASDDVFVDFLGPKHAAVLLEQSKSLLVTFDHHSEFSAQSGTPVGWALAQRHGWSHLCIISETQDWFRDPNVIHHFDRLIDDGFLDQFDKVVFYGHSAGDMPPQVSASAIQWPPSSRLIHRPV